MKVNENVSFTRKTPLICKRTLQGRQSVSPDLHRQILEIQQYHCVCVCIYMCMFRELGHEGSCCQNTISSSKQQLHFSGCPNPCSHPTTANSHHWRPSLTLLPHSQGLLFFRRSLTHTLRPLVLYPLHHLHHFVFLQCMFLRWLSRPEAQGSGIVSLFFWDILMRLNIFSILFQPPPSYFLAHFIYCLFVLILILILYMFSLSIPSFSTPPQISWQSLQLAVQSICFHSLGQICFSGYLTPFHVVLHNVIKKSWGIMSATRRFSALFSFPLHLLLAFLLHLQISSVGN